MRVDKFLKNSRIIKRRTVAKEACDKGRVTVNDRVAKAGTELVVGDVVEIRYNENTFKFKVITLLEHLKKEDAEKMYEIIQ